LKRKKKQDRLRRQDGGEAPHPPKKNHRVAQRGKKGVAQRKNGELKRDSLNSIYTIPNKRIANKYFFLCVTPLFLCATL